MSADHPATSLSPAPAPLDSSHTVERRRIEAANRLDGIHVFAGGDSGLRQLLDNSASSVFVKDADGRYLFANQRCCEFLGLPEERVVGYRLDELLPDSVAKVFRGNDAQVLSSRTPLQFEEIVEVPQGRQVFLTTRFPLFDNDGKVYAVGGISTDITERKRTEDALRRVAIAVSEADPEAVFQQLCRHLAEALGVECAFIAMCSTPENDSVRTLAVYADGSFEENIEYELAGTACGTVVGKSFRFLPSGARSTFPHDRMFRRLAIEGYSAFPLNQEDGTPVGLIAVLSRRPLADERMAKNMLQIFASRAAGELVSRRARQAQQISEASYRAIFDATEDAVLVHDWETGAIVDVNPKACEMYGYSRDELIAMSVVDLSSGVEPYTGAEAHNLLQEAKSGKSIRFEWQRKSRDGSLHWDEVHLKAAVMPGKRRFLSFTRDITHRKRIEDALRSAALAVSNAEGDGLFEELVRYLTVTLRVDVAFIAQFIDDVGGRMRGLACYIDGRWIPDFEYELRGTPCDTVVGREFRIYPERLMELFPVPGVRGLALESYAAFPLFDSQGRPLGLIAIADRKRMRDPILLESVLKIFAARAVSEIERQHAERAMRASEEQYRSMFNASVDGMVMLDSQGQAVDANPAYLALFGCTREQVIGQEQCELLEADSRRLCAELREVSYSGDAFQRECTARRGSGEAIEIEVRGVQMHYQGRPHLLCIVRDITERKRAEAQRGQLEAQLRQAQKMEAIGHLTGGIAHDFNNILTSVMGYLVLASERQVDLGDSRLGKYLEQAHVASTRARDLIQKMLTFSRGKHGEARALSLSPVIKECIKLLRSTLPSTIDLQTDIAAELPAVRFDPVQAEQVLMNLCINARDALKGPGTIRVTVKPAEVDGICASCRGPVRGSMVEVTVRDTGAGIAPEVAERIFEPFFSTKEIGKGSGMGLSTVHGIAHEHGGHILLESAPGKGATFRVLLPAIAQSAAEVEHPARRAPRRRPKASLSGRVLVVDDEEMVGEFMGDLLQSWGLRTTVKNSAIDARELVTKNPRAFDLILIDQTMPKLTGVELAREISALRPELPLILYTGYSESLSATDVERAGIRALIQKPIDPSVLLPLLKSHLPGKRAARGA